MKRPVKHPFMVSMIGLTPLTSFVLAMLVVCVVEASAEPHKLRDYQLGMTVSEARAVDFKPYIDPAHGTPAAVVRFMASSDKDWETKTRYDEFLLTTSMTKDENEIGVVIGSLFRPHTLIENNFSNMTIKFGGEHLLGVKFYFIAPRAGEEPRLYKIQAWTDRYITYTELKDLYTKALGEATESDQHIEQNIFGAIFEAEVSVWRNDSSEIVVFSSHPYRNKNAVYFEFHHHKLSEVYESLVANLKSDAISEL